MSSDWPRPEVGVAWVWEFIAPRCRCSTQNAQTHTSLLPSIFLSFASPLPLFSFLLLHSFCISLICPPKNPSALRFVFCTRLSFSLRQSLPLSPSICLHAFILFSPLFFLSHTFPLHRLPRSPPLVGEWPGLMKTIRVSDYVPAEDGLYGEHDSYWL